MTATLSFQASAVATATVAGSPVIITRPNNTTAYTAGQVYGPAADARTSITLPAAPAGFRTGFISQATWGAYLTRNPNDVLSSPWVNMIFFSAQPATVLGDQASFALSDADIALILPSGTGSQSAGQPTVGTAQANWLNSGTGVNGRRACTLTPTFAGTPLFAPGSTIWFYLIANSYTPVALETLTIVPFWTYTAVPTA